MMRYLRTDAQHDCAAWRVFPSDGEPWAPRCLLCGKPASRRLARMERRYRRRERRDLRRR